MDLSGFRPMLFEIEPKAASLNMRLPVFLLDAAKAKVTFLAPGMCAYCWRQMSHSRRDHRRGVSPPAVLASEQALRVVSACLRLCCQSERC